MSEQMAGFYFNCNADKSADFTIYVEQTESGTFRVGVRYKNSGRNSCFEIKMDTTDLYTFSQLCIDLFLIIE